MIFVVLMFTTAGLNLSDRSAKDGTAGLRPTGAAIDVEQKNPIKLKITPTANISRNAQYRQPTQLSYLIIIKPPVGKRHCRPCCQINPTHSISVTTDPQPASIEEEATPPTRWVEI
jgi:hypothetical protein